MDQPSVLRPWKHLVLGIEIHYAVLLGETTASVSTTFFAERRLQLSPPVDDFNPFLADLELGVDEVGHALGGEVFDELRS